MKNTPRNSLQRKTTLKWDTNGELSSIDMARVINILSVTELKECKLTCERIKRDKKLLDLGLSLIHI